MKPEQRLMVALGLTFFLLLIWTSLFPPQKPESSFQPTQNKEVTEKKDERWGKLPALQSFSVGGLSLGIGQETGGIHSLKVDGTELLKGTLPGILQVELVGKEVQPLSFETSQPGEKTITITSEQSRSVRVMSTITPDESDHPFLSDIELKIQNSTQESRIYQIRFVAYRPLDVHPREQQYQSGIVSIDGKEQTFKLKPGQKISFSGNPAWVAAQAKSHTLIFQPDQPVGMFHVEHSPQAGIIGWWELPEAALLPGEEKQWNFRWYAGPIDLPTLKSAQMDHTFNLGSFSGISKLLVEFLDWGHHWLGNYGWSILLLSFVVWLPVSPLTWYGMRSSHQMMQKMAQIRPQEARIRKEHAKNPQRLQQEMMELYRKHGVNPASGCIGCLPFLLTMPIYIALFQVLNRAPQLRGAPFLWIKDLSAPDALIRFGSAIPLIGESFNILPILAVVGTFFQQKFMRPPQESLTDEQKVQQQVFRFMPLMLLFFFYHMPSGFVLYWVVNTALMTGQQFLIARTYRG